MDTQRTVDGHVDTPRGKQAVTETTAAIDAPLRARAQTLEQRLLLGAEKIRVAGRQHRLRQAGALACVHRSAVARRRPAQRADPTVIGHQVIDDSDYRDALMQQCDEGAKYRQAGDKRCGAVDRVEHPDIFGIGVLRAVLLPEDAVRRKLRLDHGAQSALDALVGIGDITRIRLQFDGGARQQRPGHDLPAPVGQCGSERDMGVLVAWCVPVAGSTRSWAVAYRGVVVGHGVCLPSCGVG